MHKSKISSKQSQAGSKVTKIKQLLTKALDEVRSISPKRLSLRFSPPKRTSDQSSQCQSMAEVLQNLKKGYLITKHSQNTKQPHIKFIYISRDNKYICWKSVDKDDQKKIQISTITKIIKDKAEFFMKGTEWVKNLYCCLVIVSEERTLQLEASSEIEAELIKQELSRLLVYSRGMSLNYKYNI